MIIKFKQEIKKSAKIDEKKIIETILKNRNITDIESFLHPPSPLDIHLSDFGYDSEIKHTLKILETIHKAGKTIVVYTDYDADGITGGTILWETLHLLGFKVMPYVPHRQHEGYGFSIKGIDAIKEKFNPALIISVDHGITAVEQIKYAKSIGIPIIITDHHFKQPLIPDQAEAIFHIPALSGSGVSYFFSKMVFEHFKNLPKDTFSVSTHNLETLTHNFETEYTSIASIGTIADLVPLVGPSRSLIKYGLEKFKDLRRLGLKHLMREAGIEDKIITPYEVGFMIAPRINAIGRLGHALDALRLLCTSDETKAAALSLLVGDVNKDRQNLVLEAVTEAKATVASLTTVPKLIVLSSDKWHEGIIGLIASKLVEQYYRPVIIMTKGDLYYKGSARSTPQFHITNFLKEYKGEYLIDAGGHTQAAGFTIEAQNIEKFIATAQAQADEMITDEHLIPTIEADLKIEPSHISIALIEQLQTLAPFGIGNPEPLFYTKTVLVDAKQMGKKLDHLRLNVCTTDSNKILEVVAFGKGEMYSRLSRDMEIDLVYKLEINEWNGKRKINAKAVYVGIE